MSLVTSIDSFATRVAQEFNAVRTEMSSITAGTIIDGGGPSSVYAPLPTAIDGGGV